MRTGIPGGLSCLRAAVPLEKHIFCFPLFHKYYIYCKKFWEKMEQKKKSK